jgi:hypothetical protein
VPNKTKALSTNTRSKHTHYGAFVEMNSPVKCELPMLAESSPDIEMPHRVGRILRGTSPFGAICFMTACLMVFSPDAWGAGDAASFPGPGEGYQITQNDSTQPAPAGYEGKTDTSTRTAVGNTPATAGKRVVATFKFGNQIKTCPQGDGTAEGDGVFSVTMDRTDAQANGTSTTHTQMLAKAKYKGEVGEDAYIKNPVKAEIDFTYDVSGTIRDKSGALATPAGSHSAQHITIPINVAGGMEAPSFGDFSGGDPFQAHYADAFSVGTALAYWAGVYYSVAQMKWRTGECAQVTFTPPSGSSNLTPGQDIHVNAEVKSKDGQSSTGKFRESHAFGGKLNPETGPAPMKFTYTAPTSAVKNTGFQTIAVSRAGIGMGEWQSGVHGGWSGRITFELTNDAPEIHDQMRDISGHANYQTTLVFKNGVGTALGSANVKSSAVMRQNALRGGAHTIIVDTRDEIDGSADGSSQATVQVNLDKAGGTYQIFILWDGKQIGRPFHTVYCKRENCTSRDGNMLWVGPERVTSINGKLSDLTHLQGSKTEQSSVSRDYITGNQKHTISWDVSWTTK